MGIQREQLLSLLDPSNSSPSLSYWTSILSFFENNQKQLDLSDMKIICEESERCREYSNTDREYPVTVYRNGHESVMMQIDKGLGITKEKVSPKVYDYLKELQDEEYRADEEETYMKPGPIPVTTDAIPLAAHPHK